MSDSLNFAFREQARFCAEFGSPFTQLLLQRAADDLEAGGAVAQLYSVRSDWRRADAAPLRLAGALHARACDGKAPRLAALYPAPGKSWDMDAVWPEALDAIAADPAHFASFVALAPQTNETRRAIGLLSAFLELGRASAPLHMLELGASAGLNLHWDKFAYDAGAWTWRGGPGPLIDTEWTAPAPNYLGPLNIASRAGCDINPLDIRDVGARQRLRSFIWADQFDRLARFDAAAALALNEGVGVDAADAGAWIAARLAQGLSYGVTIVYHSVFWQYLPRETAQRTTAAIEAAGAGADDARRLAWVRFEHDKALGGPSEDYIIDVQTWPGGARRVLARADPHGRWYAPPAALAG